jgi:alpha-mannosidase
VETIKPAEDQSGDIIIRLYECMKAATRTTISTALKSQKIYSCNMLEKTEGDAISNRNEVTLEFRPFEVKTLRLRR